MCGHVKVEGIVSALVFKKGKIWSPLYKHRDVCSSMINSGGFIGKIPVIVAAPSLASTASCSASSAKVLSEFSALSSH